RLTSASALNLLPTAINNSSLLGKRRYSVLRLTLAIRAIWSTFAPRTPACENSLVAASMIAASCSSGVLEVRSGRLSVAMFGRPRLVSSDRVRQRCNLVGRGRISPRRVDRIERRPHDLAGRCPGERRYQDDVPRHARAGEVRRDVRLDACLGQP